MAKVILITGGARSGKSSYAESRAESFAGKKVYIATCPRLDTELEERIRKHREARKNKGWRTVEEEIDIAPLVSSLSADIILVDCLTLWINNLLYNAEKSGETVNEEEITSLCTELIRQCSKTAATIIFVTNEVGSGIVPESATARRYRDLVGRCNQLIAQFADEVVLVSCGIPLHLKNLHNDS